MKYPSLIFALLLLPSLLVSQDLSGYIDYNCLLPIHDNPGPEGEQPDLLFTLTSTHRLYFTERSSLSYPLSIKETTGRDLKATLSQSTYRLNAQDLRGESLNLPLEGEDAQAQRAALTAKDVKPETAASLNGELEGQYIALDKQRDILGFSCQAYYNESSDMIFWITQELPSHLSVMFQEVEGKILEGAILKVESEKWGYLVEATNIHYCAVDEAYLRETPLYEVEVEELLEE